MKSARNDWIYSLAFIIRSISNENVTKYFNRMLQELSKLFAPEAVPSPNEMDRLYIYNVENKFLRITMACFLDMKYYRTYYLRIRNTDETFLERRIEYVSLCTWRQKISEINTALYNLHEAMKI